MIDKLRQRRENEEGFTLIELMVVVLIIAILLAIAIPTFLGARDRANDRAAQSSLRNALTAAKVIFTDEQNYQSATASKLIDEEPSLKFQTTASTGFKVVSFATPAVTTFQAAALSKSGTCYYIKDVASNVGGGTFYGEGETCDGASASAAALGEW